MKPVLGKLYVVRKACSVGNRGDIVMYVKMKRWLESDGEFGHRYTFLTRGGKVEFLWSDMDTNYVDLGVYVERARKQ